MDLKFSLTLLVSFGALLFSFLNFKRSRKFENENFIYKTKIDIYSKILAELSKLLNALEENLEEAKEYFEDRFQENANSLDDQADKVDDFCFSFKDFIIASSLIIPEHVSKRLDNFCEKVLDAETLDSETKDNKTAIATVEKLIEELTKNADDINALLRKDLHVEELNSSLYRRLKHRSIL